MGKKPDFDHEDFEFPEEFQEELSEEELIALRRKKRRAMQEKQRRDAKKREILFVAVFLAVLTLVAGGLFLIIRSVREKNTNKTEAENTAEESTSADVAEPDDKASETPEGSSEAAGNTDTEAEESKEPPVTAPSTDESDIASVITNSEETTTAETRTDEQGNWLPPYPTDIKVPSWITVDLIDVNEKVRPGRLLTSVDNIVVHYVGNPNTTAKSNRDFFNDIPLHENEKGASAHFVVGLDGEVVQCIPLGEVAFANYPRNDFTISIETCHPDDTGKFSETTYWSLIRLVSWLCEEYGLSSEQVIRHYDVSGKYCPCYYCPNNQDNPYGHPEAWDQLKADVAYYITRFPNIGEIDP